MVVNGKEISRGKKGGAQTDCEQKPFNEKKRKKRKERKEEEGTK